MRQSITARAGKSTFRRLRQKATLVTNLYCLNRSGEDVKALRLLRHSSSRITTDIYAQAQMPAKRAAQQKVVAMVRVEKTPLLNCSPNCSAAKIADFR